MPFCGGVGLLRRRETADLAIADLEAQLELLGTDDFDGMRIHDPGESDPTLEKGGYGMRRHDFHLKAMATGDIDLIRCFNDYNLIRQTAADDILPYAAEHDIGVMNGGSILRGILTGVDIDAEIARGRWKKEGDVAAAAPIWEWCVEDGISLLQLALQFCLKEERIQGNNNGKRYSTLSHSLSLWLRS